jgi:hypothetical protein
MVKLVKQKEKRYIHDMYEAICSEVTRLLQARFIREVDYPSWLVNHVLVKKSDGSW